LRREVRPVDPPGPAGPRLLPARLGRALRWARRRAGRGGLVRRPLDPPPARQRSRTRQRGRGDPRAHPPRDGGARRMSALRRAPIALVVPPALAVVLWPLWRARGAGAPARAPVDRRLELSEDKARVYRALRELRFDHEAGHLSEEDYRELSDRYESRAA